MCVRGVNVGEGGRVQDRKEARIEVQGGLATGSGCRLKVYSVMLMVMCCGVLFIGLVRISTELFINV